MDINKIREWAIAAGVRAFKTAAQTAVAMIPVGVGISEVGWVNVLGTAALAALVSILTSIAGVPEVAGGACVFGIRKAEQPDEAEEMVE